MTEPTQDEIDIAYVQNWAWKDNPLANDGCFVKEDYLGFAAAYANHVTAELQAQIERLEIGLMELEKVAAAWRQQLMAAETQAEDLARKLENYEEQAEGYQFQLIQRAKRIVTLEAELAARDFVPISDEHKDGFFWQVCWHDEVGFPGTYAHWDKQFNVWRTVDGKHFRPTHAAPLPKPPAREGE